MIDIISIPVLGDNYVYLAVNGRSAVAVDPGEAEPVLSELRRRDLTLSAVALTHHHADHTGGAAALAREYRCPVAGPPDRRLACVDTPLADGAVLHAGGIDLRAIHVPGHTLSHCAFMVDSAGLLFSGDTLFAAGCGRIFEGTGRLMWQSLERLAALPDATKVYCGHEYTEENLRFALSILPGAPWLAERLADVRRRLRQSGSSMPTTMAVEKATNLFLRCDDPAVAGALGMTGARLWEVFAELRSRKDRF